MFKPNTAAPMKATALWVALLITSTGACNGRAPDPATTPTVAANAAPAEHSCFWDGPWVREDPARSYAYPDTGAAYWAARLRLPDGATLQLQGDYPQARYASLVLYDADGAPTDALHDALIQPDAGSRNPFIDGAERAARPRRWTVQVRAEAVPARRAANTLYAGPEQRDIALLYRVYVPDQGRGRTGGVDLPQAQLRLADGRLLAADDSCVRAEVNREAMPNTVAPRPAYLLARERPLKAGALPDAFPATQPLQWHAFYDARVVAACAYLGECGGQPERKGGVYSNPDNAYLWAMTSRRLGPVLVLQGTMPRVPATRSGRARFQAGDLRYWSLCNYEAYTQRASACVYDEQVPLDAKRRYTVVVSRAADRPRNARAECGVAWVDWGEAGDGAGHDDDGMLFLRNMLPSPGFAQAVQNTRTPGDEAAVLGDYLPGAVYTDTAGFEQRGCSKPSR
ncbi:hypothetical protein SAMN04488068_2792 [Hydrocarboniphaga daqingensis]|uniref:Uncharacterized protein n=1 Tax=Hydrocarboniphaga daqingensis TaxID=490188 RepID=A0A1M5QSD6_9GAMM|nr:hypothetical protein [Hydrocarboniphaga daqingensis]SHH16801.1 hypothetical protein SAMN04488068_2792 [Hydrocarboniphaga daqingensis]